MHSSPFPSCCGATILHGFGEGQSSCIMLPVPQGLVIAITNKSQTRAEEQLKRNGFNRVRRFSGDRLTLWVRGGTVLRSRATSKKP